MFRVAPAFRLTSPNLGKVVGALHQNSYNHNLTVRGAGPDWVSSCLALISVPITLETLAHLDVNLGNYNSWKAFTRGRRRKNPPEGGPFSDSAYRAEWNPSEENGLALPRRTHWCLGNGHKRSPGLGAIN